MFFTSWSYFIEFLLSFKLLFTVLKNSYYLLKYDRSKSEATTGYLWEAQTKTAKKDYFTKILSSPRFFEIST